MIFTVNYDNLSPVVPTPTTTPRPISQGDLRGTGRRYVQLDVQTAAVDDQPLACGDQTNARTIMQAARGFKREFHAANFRAVRGAVGGAVNAALQTHRNVISTVESAAARQNQRHRG